MPSIHKEGLSSDTAHLPLQFCNLRIGNADSSGGDRNVTIVNPFLRYAKATLKESSVNSQPLNPFKPFIRTKPSKTELEDLIIDVLKPQLGQKSEFNWLSPDDPCFLPVKALWEKYQWPEQAFFNFRDLLCGCRNIPLILLTNPKNDDLPFDDMVARTSTLSWLKKVLHLCDLTLKDVMIMDLFPMLSDNRLDALDESHRDDIVREIFSLTVGILSDLKPSIIISCQCFARSPPARFRSFNHPLVDSLCSSIAGARGQRVLTATIGNFETRVVQAFHPAKIDYETGEERALLDRTLRVIFELVFTPCGKWKAKLEGDFYTMISEVHAAASKLSAFISTHEQILVTANASRGHMETESGEWPKLKNTLAELLNTLGCVSSVKNGSLATTRTLQEERPQCY
jgi:hypothetical protein